MDHDIRLGDLVRFRDSQLHESSGLGLVTSLSSVNGYSGVDVTFASGSTETWSPRLFVDVFLIVASGVSP